MRKTSHANVIPYEALSCNLSSVMAGLDPAIHFSILRGGRMDGRLGGRPWHGRGGNSVHQASPFARARRV